VSRRAQQSAIQIWIDYDYRDQITNATYRVDYYQLFCCCTPSYHDNLAFGLTSTRISTEISVDHHYHMSLSHKKPGQVPGRKLQWAAIHGLSGTCSKIQMRPIMRYNTSISPLRSVFAIQPASLLGSQLSYP
jgi:hypothetical protein